MMAQLKLAETTLATMALEQGLSFLPNLDRLNHSACSQVFKLAFLLRVLGRAVCMSGVAPVKAAAMKLDCISAAKNASGGGVIVQLRDDVVFVDASVVRRSAVLQRLPPGGAASLPFAKHSFQAWRQRCTGACTPHDLLAAAEVRSVGRA